MQASQLSEILHRAFLCYTIKSRVSDPIEDHANTDIHYLEIPISSEVFEVPVMAFKTFLNRNLEGFCNADAIVIALQNKERTAVYVTPDRNMRDILIADWGINNIIHIPVKQGTNTIIYYGGHGILLTGDFKPIIMLSWQVKRIQLTDRNGNTKNKYKIIKPIIRIDSSCFNSSDPMMKWCINKLFKSSMQEKIAFPWNEEIRSFLIGNTEDMSPSIVIEENPFSITTPDVPDVLTTREEILRPAIDHIDELLQ